MELEGPDKTIIYTIENCIKTYRKFAQANIRQVNSEITIDQVLLLVLIHNSPELTQQELAVKLFKDNASVTRIIQLLIKRNYLEKTSKIQDKREYDYHITSEGARVIEDIIPIIKTNRAIALRGLVPTEISELQRILNKISANCQDNNKNFASRKT